MKMKPVENQGEWQQSRENMRTFSSFDENMDVPHPQRRGEVFAAS